MLNPRTLSIIAALGLSAIGGAVEPSPAPTPATAPVRTVLERDPTGVPSMEVTMGTAFLPAGAAIGFHTHAGDEFGYILKGPLVLKKKGEPDRILQTGDAFFNARGVVHSLATLPGNHGGTALSVWIIDKGQPLSTPAVK
jgi:quercetin dioxygenase-like cupin family protein